MPFLAQVSITNVQFLIGTLSWLFVDFNLVIRFMLLPRKHLLVLKTSSTSSRHVLKTSSTRVQRNNFTSSKKSWRRLEDVLQRRFEDVLKTPWRPLARRLEDVLEDEKLLRWRRLEDMSWRCLEDMYWRRLEDIMERDKILTGNIYI